MNNRKKISKETLMKITNSTKKFCKKVVCLNNKKEFNSLKEAASYYNMKTYVGISRCCNNIASSAGRDNEDNPLVWAYYEDYKKLSEKEISEKIKNATGGNIKKIICLNTNQGFKSTLQASRDLNISKSSIHSCLKGRQKTSGVINGEKLKWMYYSDYLKQQENNK